MLTSRKLVESVIPLNLKQLLNETNNENLNRIDENLKLNLKQVKDEITSLAKANINQINPELEKSEIFIKKINSLHNQIGNIKNELEDQENLLKNVAEIEKYKSLIDHIEMINKIISIIEKLQQFDYFLNELSSAIDNKNYTKCNENLNKLKELADKSEELFKTNEELDSLVKKENQNLDHTLEKDILIVRELKEDLIVQRERLWYEIDQEWDNLIKIDVDSDNCFNSYISIKNSINQEHIHNLTQLAKFKLPPGSNNSATNKQYSDLSSFVFLSRMKQFSKKFLELCQANVINENDLEVDIKQDYDCYKLYFKKSNLKVNKDDDGDVIEIKILEFKLSQLEKLINFLNENFFNLNTYLMSWNKQQNKFQINQTKLIRLFSQIMLNDFVKLIYEQLIINIIPLKNFDYKLEAKICEHVNKFEKSLQSIAFLVNEKDSVSVFKCFINDVEELYVRKKCKHIMNTARNLMRNKDLIFDLVHLDDRHFNLKQKQFISTSNSMYLIQELVKMDEKNMNKSSIDDLNLLNMPQCSISKLASKILELIYETLSEAQSMVDKAQNIKNVSLMCIITRNLFDLYASVVPTYHNNNLKEIPILSAITFNDFTYLAFNCLTITHQYSRLFSKIKNSKLSSIYHLEMEDVVSNFSCLDLIPKLYSIGYENFNKQIEKQLENLMQFMNEDSNGVRFISLGNNYELLKKSLQKCIYQLNNLSSLWVNILPKITYYKVFGQLLEYICNDLLKSCLDIEDYSADDASYLHSAFVLIKQCVFDIFSKHAIKKSKKNLDNDTNNDDSSETCNELANISLNNNLADLNAVKYVKSWQRFKYLMIILKANLQDIVDLWSDGKGPLAMCYDWEEVRNLIKALFMDTDRRKDALAKIK